MEKCKGHTYAGEGGSEWDSSGVPRARNLPGMLAEAVQEMVRAQTATGSNLGSEEDEGRRRRFRGLGSRTLWEEAALGGGERLVRK